MRKLKYTALLLVVLFTASSCNKWLDLKPEDGIIRQNYWETKEQLNAAVVGCYSSLQNPDLLKQLFRWGEMRGDMVNPSLVGSIDDINIKEGNILSSNTITDWSDVYQTINYCNTVLQFGPTVTAKDNTLTPIQLNAYLGEAHAIRGLMYFYLLRAFGEVPLQLTATASDASLQQLEKSSKEEVNKVIIDDLKFAETSVPVNYGSVLNDKGRITKYAVYAMLADVYLWNDDYEDCITYCQKVEDSNQYALFQATSQQSFFNTVIRNGNSVEGIFELQFDSQKQNPAYGLFAASNRPYVIGDKVTDYYGIDDVDPLNKDYRGDGCSIKADDQSIAKSAGIYSGSDFKLVDNSNSTANWLFYRYSDVLLMKAEALAWSDRPNSGTDALALIDRVRKRANALAFTEEAPSDTSPEDITAYILRERSREFAYEGKRWFDMLRIAKRNNYQQLDLMLDIIAEAAPSDRQQSIIGKYRDVRSHYFPIGEKELQADHKLVQNPYYQ
nr:RagB/SusD family nutrient uptake outer membrane protein [uncultured Pedobacter sp.]